jgi:hypothetical protein
MRLTERLFLRIIVGGGTCPADTAPYDEDAGDIDVTGSISSGTAKGVIYDLNNIAGLTLGTTAPGNGPAVCGISGTGNCTTEVVGAPFGCTNVDNGVLNAGKLALAVSILDVEMIGDGVGTLSILCQ